MTGHIAALIEEWREAEATVRKEAATWRQHHRLDLEAECLREAETIQAHVCQLEAARDADCAELRELCSQFDEYSVVGKLLLQVCSRLGGKP